MGDPKFEWEVTGDIIQMMDNIIVDGGEYDNQRVIDAVIWEIRMGRVISPCIIMRDAFDRVYSVKDCLKTVHTLKELL